MAVLRDYLSPEAQAQFPDSTLTPKGRRLLMSEVPEGYDPIRARAAASLLEEKLPEYTLEARERRRAARFGAMMQPSHGPGESLAHLRFRRENPIMRGVQQAAVGVAETLPSHTDRPYLDFSDRVPSPRGFGERLARSAGGALMFSVEAAPIAAATGGAGVAPLASAAISAALPAVAMPGTPKQRVVRGAVMGAAGAGSAVLGSVAGQIVRSHGELAAQPFAEAAAREGGEAGARMLAEGAARATSTIGRTAAAAEAVGGAALFGGVAPYAEHAALKAWGEETEAPRVEDVLSGIAELAVIGAAHGAGAAALGRRGARPAAPRPEAPPYPAAGEIVPTARPEAVERPAASMKPSRPPVPEQVAGAVFGIAKGNGTDGAKGRLDDTKPNPLDGGRTALQGFRDRVAAAGAVDDAGWVEAARKARRQVLGLRDLHEKVAEPPGATPALKEAGEAASQKWNEYLGGKGVVLKGPKGTEIGGRVEAVFIYPWAPEQFRVVLRDEATGQVVARSYPDAAAFNAEVVSVGRQPKAGGDHPKPKAAKVVAPKPEQASSQLELAPVPQAEPKGSRPSAAAERESAPAPQAPPAAPKLHRDLAGAKPRYAYGEKQFEVEFESDVDRAAYIAAQKKPSKRDAEYRKFLRDQGMDDTEIARRGEDIRSRIKQLARDGDPKKGPLKIAAQHEVPGLAGKTSHRNGDEIRYTGKAEKIHGAVWHEFEYLDGLKKGERGVTQKLPSEPKPLEQVKADVGRPEIPTTHAGAKPTKSAADAVLAMGGEARSFEEHFADLVKKGTPAQDARAEAEKLSGTTAPRDFDAEARAKSVIHRAAEDAGQASLFGAPEPAPAARRESAAVPERSPEGAPSKHAPMSREQIRAARSKGHVAFLGDYEFYKDARGNLYRAPLDAVIDLDSGYRIGREEMNAANADAHMEHLREVFAPKPAVEVESGKAVARTVRAQSIFFHEPFQQRDTEAMGGFTDKAHRNNMLEKHGGYSHDEMVKNPPTVWVDYEGRIGPADRMYVLSGHHRTELAQGTWGKVESGDWDRVSVSDRDVPVVEFKGTYDEALKEAEVSNLKGKPNTMVEQAGVVRRLTDRGMSAKEVAAEVTGGNQARARDLLNLSHLDAELLRQFFGDKGLPLNVGAYLGEFTKRHNVHAEHQRSWLQKLASREIANADELRDVVEGYLKILAAANQTDLLSQMDMGAGAITPKVAIDYLGRVMKMVGTVRREAARAQKDTKRLIERGGSKAEMKAAEVILARHRKDLAKAVRIEAEVEARCVRAIKRAIEKGESVADALHEVKEWVEVQMRGDGSERGAAPMFSDGLAGRWLARAVRDGVARAVGRSAANPLEPEGPRMDTPDFPRGFDDYADFATTRMIANWRLGNWQDILTPGLQDSYRLGSATQVYIQRRFDDMLHAAYGSDAALKYFAEGGTGSRELSNALHGLPNKIPNEFADAVGRVKKLQDDVLKALEAHAEMTGQPPPKKRADYGHAHIILGERSEPLRWLLEAIEMRGGSEMAEKEIEERHNRFFNRREGHPGYVKDATFAIKQYLHEAAMKIAWDSHLIATKDYLASPEASTVELDRANLVRDWTRIRFFRNEGGFERRADDLLRRLLFQNTNRGIREIGVERAAKALNTTTDALHLRGVEEVHWVPPGVDYDSAKGQILGAWAGGTLIGTKGDVVLATGSPLPRALVRGAMSVVKGRLKVRPRDDEAWIRHQWKVERGIDDLENAPSAAILSAITGRISASIFWWNVSAASINATGTFVTTLPEYGARAYLAGLYGAGKALTRAAVRKGLRAYLWALERAGSLSADDARTARESLPLLVEEVYAEAAGTLQREAVEMEQRAIDIAEGKNPDVRAGLRAFVTRGDFLFSTAEGFNRTVSILAADHFARREFGTTRGVPEMFENMQAARERMLGELGKPGSPEAFAARSTLLDQFAYDPGSFPMAFSGPYGRTVFQLMRWTLAALKRYGLRPTEGAVRVGAAAIRGMTVGAARGPSAREGPYRPGGPKPKGWFEEWLEYNGAGWQHRHASAVFIRQTAIASLLLGATMYVGVAFSNAGVPPHVMLALWLLRQFFKDDEDIARWYQQGKEGAMLSTERLPVGPVAQGVVQGASAAFQFVNRKDPAALSQFPWESILGTFRLWAIRGEPQIKRMVQENPDWFADHAPWVFKAFGIRRVMPGLTPSQTARHQTRTMTVEERRELSVPVQE